MRLPRQRIRLPHDSRMGRRGGYDVGPFGHRDRAPRRLPAAPSGGRGGRRQAPQRQLRPPGRRLASGGPRPGAGRPRALPALPLARRRGRLPAAREGHQDQRRLDHRRPRPRGLPHRSRHRPERLPFRGASRPESRDHQPPVSRRLACFPVFRPSGSRRAAASICAEPRSMARSTSPSRALAGISNAMVRPSTRLAATPSSPRALRCAACWCAVPDCREASTYPAQSSRLISTAPAQSSRALKACHRGERDRGPRQRPASQRPHRG